MEENQFWEYMADKTVWFGKWVLPVLAAGGFALAVGPKVFGYDHSNSTAYDAESVTLERNVLEEVKDQNQYGLSLPGDSVADVIDVRVDDSYNTNNSLDEKLD